MQKIAFFHVFSCFACFEGSKNRQKPSKNGLCNITLYPPKTPQKRPFLPFLPKSSFLRICKNSKIENSHQKTPFLALFRYRGLTNFSQKHPKTALFDLKTAILPLFDFSKIVTSAALGNNVFKKGGSFFRHFIASNPYFRGRKISWAFREF